MALTNLSDDDLVRLCNNPNSQVIGGFIGGRRFIQLSSGIVVKCGWSVTPEEAANQEYAYSCHSDLKIPEVYRYFRASGVGYLVMEFIEGISLENIPLHQYPDLIPRLATAIHTLAGRILPGPPGPRNGGIPRGYLFSEDGAGKSFSSITCLNSWFNERFRLRKDEPGFDFKLSDCVFCHLDLARRNIIMLPDESFALLDWESAGFYPRVFETYCLRFVGQSDYDFTQALLSALDNISPGPGDQEEKERYIRMLDRVFRNNLKFSFHNPTNHAELQLLVKDFAVPKLNRRICPP